MSRPATAIHLLLAACAAPSPASPVPVDVSHVTLADAAQAWAVRGADVAAEAAAAAADESELRAALAQAVDPTPVALALVRLLDGEERLREGLLVLDTAIARAPQDPVLLVARCGVLRDLGRRAEAFAALAEIDRHTEGAALSPGLVFELAELAALEGNFDAAGPRLERLLRDPAAVEFLAERRSEVDALTAAVAAQRPLVAVRVRDVLGDLRGHADPARRRTVFAVLAGIEGDVRERAVLCALDDPDAEVRAAAVATADVDPEQLREFCGMALSDPEPAVRLAGVARAISLADGDAVPALLAVLAAEADGTVLRAVHEALQARRGRSIEFPPGAIADAAARRQLVAWWREAWEQ